MSIPHLERRGDKTALIVHDLPLQDECILLVNRCGLMFASACEEKPNLDILSLEEGEIRNGEWKTIRRLNGDEAAFMKYDVPTLLRLKVFIYR